jgi:PKD repeat protein
MNWQVLNRLLLLIAIVCLIVYPITAQDIVAKKNNVDIRAWTGEMQYQPDGLSQVTIETSVNGQRFVATDTNKPSTTSVRYASSEKYFYVFPDPKVQQEYQVFENGSIEETLFLKERSDITWNIELTGDDSLLAEEDGSYSIIHPGSDQSIHISKPEGWDAKGVHITYTYELGKDGHTLTLIDPQGHKNDNHENIAYPVIVDPVVSNSYNLKLLLHGNYELPSTNSTADFRDSSRSFFMPTSPGGIPSVASINTTIKKFGNASIYFPSGSNVTILDDPAFTFATNNLSITASINWTGSISPIVTLYSHTQDANNMDYLTATSANVSMSFVRSGVSLSAAACPFTPSINNWYNISYIQNGTSGQIYVNGTACGAPVTRTGSYTNLAAPVTIGNPTTVATFVGFIDEVKVFNGGFGQNIGDLEGEYPLFLNGTTNAGYADDNYTVSLLHFDGTNGSTFFKDQVGNKSYIAAGNAIISTNWYKFGSGSYSVQNPSASYIWFTGYNLSSWNHGTSDFTIDLITNVTATPINAEGLWGRIADSNNYEFLGFAGNGVIRYLHITGGTVRADVYFSYPTTLNVPHHVVFERKGSDPHAFIDGIETPVWYGVPFNGNLDLTSANTVYIGTHPAAVGQYNFTGNIDELRITNGLARWTANFTPPTYPYEVTQPSFTQSSTASGTAPVTVSFTDTTLDSAWTNNTYLWVFGDGGTSTLANPSHTYTTTGIFTVTENVYNNNMTASSTSTVLVGAPVVDFMGTPTAGTAAMQVAFTDLTVNTTPISAYLIEYGDGTTATTTPPWVHVYSTFGVYSVNVTETNSIGTGFRYKQDYIITSTPQGQNTIIYPTKDVRFHLQTIWGQSLPGARVLANASQTTLGNYSYVASLYGYQFANVPLNTLTLNGTTDSRGDITFAMMADTQYLMNYTLVGYTFPSGTTITPHDDNYVIYANFVGSTFITNGTSPQASINYSVLTNRTNTTSAKIFVNFSDTAGSTTGGFVTLYRTNSTFGNNSPNIVFVNESFTGNSSITNYTFIDTPTASCPVSNATVYNGTGLLVGCYNVTLVNGQSCSAKTIGYTPNGNVAVQDPIWFRNIASPIAGLSAEFALFMALGILMFTAMMAGISTAPPVSLAVTFEGWIFYGSNMLNLIDSVAYVGGIGISSVEVVLTMMTFISIIFLFVSYRRSGK